MSRRERLERKLDRREEWAGKADARSEAAFGRAAAIADGIPFGQPILVGHHSERHARRDAERIRGGMDRGVMESRKATHHRDKADGLARQLDRTVFSDDADAIEKLEERIAANEKKHDRMKDINRLYKKGDAEGLKARHGLDLDRLREKIEHVRESDPWVKTPFESYQLTNLGARIRADKKRIEEIRARGES